MTAPKAKDGKRVTHARHKFIAAQPQWMFDGACRGTDTSLWFPTSEKDDVVEEAKDICACCPVIAECLQWAYDTGSSDGIFGGLTATERKSAKRNAQRRRHAKEMAS